MMIRSALFLCLLVAVAGWNEESMKAAKMKAEAEAKKKVRMPSANPFAGTAPENPGNAIIQMATAKRNAKLNREHAAKHGETAYAGRFTKHRKPVDPWKMNAGLTTPKKTKQGKRGETEKQAEKREAGERKAALEASLVI